MVFLSSNSGVGDGGGELVVVGVWWYAQLLSVSKSMKSSISLQVLHAAYRKLVLIRSFMNSCVQERKYIHN